MVVQPDYFTILNGLKDGIIVVDLNGKTIFSNEAAHQLLKYLPPKIHYTNAEIKHWLTILNAGKTIESQDIIFINKNNTPTYLLLTIDAYRNHLNGDLIGVVQILKDITNQKISTEKLTQLNASLADDNKFLAQFAHIISHDLQQEFRNINNFTELLSNHLHGSNDEELAFLLSVVSGTALKASSLVESLLQYARTGTNRKMEEFNSRFALEAALKKLKFFIAEKGATIHIGDMPVIKGNSNEIELVFYHLLSNALIFITPFVKPVIYVSCKVQNLVCQFSIKDNGIGIRQENWGKIFTVFTRLNAAESYPGLGMGLTLCKKIIEHHGGNIWVKSQFENGSVFCFTILNS